MLKCVNITHTAPKLPGMFQKRCNIASCNVMLQRRFRDIQYQYFAEMFEQCCKNI